MKDEDVKGIVTKGYARIAKRTLVATLMTFVDAPKDLSPLVRKLATLRGTQSDT